MPSVYNEISIVIWFDIICIVNVFMYFNMSYFGVSMLSADFV